MDDVFPRLEEEREESIPKIEIEFPPLTVPEHALHRILTHLANIERILQHMSDTLDQTNAELDQLEVAEVDLDTQVKNAIGTISKEAATLADLQQQVILLQQQKASGVAVMPSSLAALNDRINASIAKIQKESALLQSVSAPSVPAPPATTIPIPDQTSTGGTSVPVPPPAPDAPEETKV